MRSVRFFAIPLLAWMAYATLVPRFGLEDLVDSSQAIAQGRVVESWTAWDQNHRYIWTHYRIRVSDVLKGSGETEIVVSEPGGTLEGQTLRIADVVAYSTGEEVVLFARRMPNGYMRTTGLGQGKFVVRNGRVLNGGGRLPLVEVNGKTSAGRPSTALQSLNGLTVSELKARIRSLLPKTPAAP